MKKSFRYLFLIISLIFFAVSFLKNTPIETELLKAFVVPNSTQETQLIKLANLSSKQLNIIFVANDNENLQDLIYKFNSKFNNRFNSDYNFTEITQVYQKYPRNFITQSQRNLIINKNYNTLDKMALESLYNPLGIYISAPDKDPYFLTTNFALQNLKLTKQDTIEKDNKIYSVLHINIANDRDMKEIIDFQNQYKQNSNQYILLTGSPIHSYTTSSKSQFEINIICTLSTIILILFCKYYFKTTKILFPIISSILFGSLLGYSITALCFRSIHILTFVFSTSLIGIGLDYSLHYLLTKDDNNFTKNLTSSMLTTVLAFGILFFSRIEVLQQISIFTSFGLLGVYLYVLIILPLFKDFETPTTLKSYDINKYKPYFIGFILLTIFIGGIRLNFNDSIKNLYTPAKKLLTAEKIYKETFNPQTPDFIIVRGNSIDDILLKEENIAKVLDKKSIQYLALNRFTSSSKIQKENIKLTNDLYKNNLNSYATFLSKKQRADLINNTNIKIYDNSKFPLLSKFMLDKNTSFIVLFNNLNVKQINGSEILNIPQRISAILTSARKECFILFPIISIILFGFLCFNFGLKKSCLIITSPILGSMFSIGFISALGESINLFHILAVFLIIGFSLDYSIFRANGCKDSKDAVFISCSSSALSFLLLSMTSFKLISSLSSVIFLGIVTSYILSLLLISSKDTDNI